MKNVRARLAMLFVTVSCAALLGIGAGLQAAGAGGPAEPASQGQQLYNTGHYREAVKVLSTAIATSSQDAALQYWLGRSFYELRDYNLAINSLERATSLDSNRSQYHDWLGRAYGRKAEETNLFAAFASLTWARRANREFATAVRLDAGNLTAQRDLIRYLLNAPGIVGGSEEHARDQIKALTMVDAAEADLASAEMLATHKKFDEAGAVYQRILAGAPTRLDVYLEVAQYYKDRGDGAHLDQAAKLGTKAAPEDPRAGYYQAIALILLKKDPDHAEAFLRNYLAMVPDNTEVPSHASAHEWLGKLYESEGKLDAAAGEYQAALTLDPRNKNLRDALKRLQKN